jgi:hypothetical protein
MVEIAGKNMNPDKLVGYHSEWNLVCPGGSDYQRMAQIRGKLCWKRIKDISGLEIELDFDHPLASGPPSKVQSGKTLYPSCGREEDPG